MSECDITLPECPKDRRLARRLCKGVIRADRPQPGLGVAAPFAPQDQRRAVASGLPLAHAPMRRVQRAADRVIHEFGTDADRAALAALYSEDGTR